MLVCGIPAYRLPRDVLQREIDALLNENVQIEYNRALGRDLSLLQLRQEGFRAFYVAVGAHRSRRLGIEGEDEAGIVSGMTFLKAHNLRGEELARGRVGIVGGGNSAVDAARVAIRQKAVKDVTIYYRRTRAEMPAYAEEVEAALEEGIRIVSLVTPQSIDPVGKGRLNVRFLKNRLGDWDDSGRRRPVPLEGSEFSEELDTLVVAIGEEPDSGTLDGLPATARGTLEVEPRGWATPMKGVFTGGDVARGPSTVIDAIADGKEAARAILRFLRGETELEEPKANLPEHFIPPLPDAGEPAPRHAAATLPVAERTGNFKEVDLAMTAEDARREATRCLRCDLEFTERTECAPALTGEEGQHD